MQEFATIHRMNMDWWPPRSGSYVTILRYISLPIDLSCSLIDLPGLHGACFWQTYLRFKIKIAIIVSLLVLSSLACCWWTVNCRRHWLHYCGKRLERLTYRNKSYPLSLSPRQPPLRQTGLVPSFELHSPKSGNSWPMWDKLAPLGNCLKNCGVCHTQYISMASTIIM